MTPVKLTSAVLVLEWSAECSQCGCGECDAANADERATATYIAECVRLRQAWDTLFPAIEHGDAEHRAWLKDKLETWLRAALEDVK